VGFDSKIFRLPRRSETFMCHLTLQLYPSNGFSKVHVCGRQTTGRQTTLLKNVSQ